MIEAIITSKTRIKLLLKFFLNSNNSAYLRALESEFGESSNGIRMELTRMEESKLLTSEMKGNKKYYRANTEHPLFDDLHSILLKFVEIDQLLKRVIAKLDDLSAAYITGDLAKGRDSKIIDLVLVGNKLDNIDIHELIEAAEAFISRKIRYVVLTRKQLIEIFHDKPVILIWKHDKYLVQP